MAVKAVWKHGKKSFMFSQKRFLEFEYAIRWRELWKTVQTANKQRLVAIK